MALAVNLAATRAIYQPVPAVIQQTVKTGILALVWIDVGLVAAVRGPQAAAASRGSGSRPTCWAAGFTPPDRFRMRIVRLGYNTNGLAHHRLTDAIDLLADEGFQSVAITLDAGALDPYEDPGVLARQLAAVRSCLDRRGLTRVVETGARYLLNPRLKHDPTLMDPDPRRRAIRADFLCRAIDIARALDAECVSLWSGQIQDAIAEEQAMDRLARRPATGPAPCRGRRHATGLRARARHVHRHASPASISSIARSATLSST